jgi:nucleotide-binding universal stress UspA family protein
MTSEKRFLVALDETEAALRAVRYLGEMVGGRDDVQIALLHVLSPLPPELLETGGAPDEESQTRIEAEQEEEQRRWIAEARRRKDPLFQRARAILEEAGVDGLRVHEHAFETIPEDKVHARILDAAEECGCDTVVMGREDRGWVADVLNRHVSHDVVKHARGLSVWVVE